MFFKTQDFLRYECLKDIVKTFLDFIEGFDTVGRQGRPETTLDLLKGISFSDQLSSTNHSGPTLDLLKGISFSDQLSSTNHGGATLDFTERHKFFRSAQQYQPWWGYLGFY